MTEREAARVCGMCGRSTKARQSGLCDVCRPPRRTKRKASPSTTARRAIELVRRDLKSAQGGRRR